MKLVKITGNAADGWRFERAPSIIQTDGRPNYSPSTEQLNALGYYDMALNAPEAVEGKVAEHEGYEVRGNLWHNVYRYVDAPPAPPKVWRRIVIWRGLAMLNLWDAFWQLLESRGLDGGWISTNDLAEDFDLGGGVTVSSLFAAVRLALPITDEQWASILAEAEVRQ